jgi:hypothetical protein
VEPGLRTPLLDFFRRGEVARDIRLLAAQGALAPRAHEQLGLLILLVGDPDPDIAAAAEATLRAIPQGALEGFLARPDAPAEMRSFFAARGIEPAATAAAEADQPIVDTSAEEERRQGVPGDQVKAADADDDEGSTVQRIARMNVAQRIALAMKGSREERAVLIRDPNKIVAVAVLSSPKMTETEIESIAKMASVSDEILRIIANTRQWMKRYTVQVALARNPKTPVAISMNLLPRLTDKDLRAISADRNVPEVLRITARQKVVMEKK